MQIFLLGELELRSHRQMGRSSQKYVVSETVRNQLIPGRHGRIRKYLRLAFKHLHLLSLRIS